MASVDVTLTGSADPRFNARLMGQLAANKGAKEARLYLSNVGYTRAGEVQQLTLRAVLRR